MQACVCQARSPRMTQGSTYAVHEADEQRAAARQCGGRQAVQRHGRRPNPFHGGSLTNPYASTGESPSTHPCRARTRLEPLVLGC